MTRSSCKIKELIILQRSWIILLFSCCWQTSYFFSSALSRGTVPYCTILLTLLWIFALDCCSVSLKGSGGNSFPTFYQRLEWYTYLACCFTLETWPQSTYLLQHLFSIQRSLGRTHRPSNTSTSSSRLWNFVLFAGKILRYTLESKISR